MGFRVQGLKIRAIEVFEFMVVVLGILRLRTLLLNIF